MAPGTRPRRTDALSRERIVDVAVELLDAAGEGGLTTRALTDRLTTGPGAIYHRVGTKDELLAAATQDLVATAVRIDHAGSTDPWGGVHAVALGLFEAIAAHPWLSPQIVTQLARSPWGSVAPLLFEAIGRQVRALGVPEHRWFTATSALMHYVLGAAGLNAGASAHARTLGPGVRRSEYLDAAATAWEELDADDYPFTRTVADQLRHHDDREEFLAGLDLVLIAITGRGAP